MSDGELKRLEVLRDLDQRRLTSEAAAQLLGLERRQVFRLLKAYRAEGAAGLISKRRGRPSNRRKPEELRDKALAIIREQYWDFGPTLAAEKLRAGHAIALGRETLRLSGSGFGLTASSCALVTRRARGVSGQHQHRTAAAIAPITLRRRAHPGST
jgi:Winged helix-turn helix